MPTPRLGLSNDLTSHMSGQVFSPIMLSNQLDGLREKASDLAIHVKELKGDVAGAKKLVYGAAGVLLSLLIGLAVATFQLIGEPIRDYWIKERNDKDHRTRIENNSAPIPQRELSPSAEVETKIPSTAKPKVGEEQTNTPPQGKSSTPVIQGPDGQAKPRNENLKHEPTADEPLQSKEVDNIKRPRTQ